jgi:Cdc6-like AAA superfamily ATPase
MLPELILKKLIDLAISATGRILRESGSKLLSVSKDVEGSIAYHLKEVETWSSMVSFRDLKKAKFTTDVFINLDLFVYPKRVRIHPEEQIDSIPLKNIFDHSPSHFVLFGQPGMGKTTSMKYLCQLLLHDENYQAERFSFPVLIKFRDLKPDASIIEEIYNILGLRVEFSKELSKDEKQDVAAVKRLKEKLVTGMLEEFKVLLILDGFDELTHEGRREGVLNPTRGEDDSYLDRRDEVTREITTRRDEVKREITILASHLEKATMIVTSRTGDFDYSIDNLERYEISPLTPQQISDFAFKWLNDETKAADFLEKIYGSPFKDTTIRPLTIAHLCAIYDRIGEIPDKPKTVYRKIVSLLLEDWNQENAVRRTSKYATFDVYRKFEFLCQLAYELTTSLQQTVFSTDDLSRVYESIYRDYDLVRHERAQVVSELETHTGLFVQSGYNSFEFAHKSLQEFLTADYIVRLPGGIGDNDTFLKLPSELAIAVTLASKPSEYFTMLVNRLATLGPSIEFISTFINRLIVEKPDFNSSFEVSLSVLRLYSTYVEFHLRESQLAPFKSDTLFESFERFIKLVLRRNTLEPLYIFYETRKIFEMENGDDLILFMGKPTPTKYASKLWVRRSFLEGS